MLVLSRKSQESVMIGGTDDFHRLLKVTVLEICGGKVKLGFEIDASVPVHRTEVWERIRARGQAGSRTEGSAGQMLPTEARRQSEDQEAYLTQEGGP